MAFGLILLVFTRMGFLLGQEYMSKDSGKGAGSKSFVSSTIVFSTQE